MNPAGGQRFECGGEPLTAEQAATAAAVPNVSAVVGTSSLRLRHDAEVAAHAAAQAAGTQFGPGGQGTPQGGPGGASAASLTTSLTSALDAGTLGGPNQTANGTTGSTPAQPAGSLPSPPQEPAAKWTVYRQGPSSPSTGAGTSALCSSSSI
ncbi:hypothetical protein ABIB27_001154 [Arthrobacter sp. UYEF21]